MLPPSLLVLLSEGVARLVSNVRASNEGLPRPRVARAQETNGPPAETLLHSCRPGRRRRVRRTRRASAPAPGPVRDRPDPHHRIPHRGDHSSGHGTVNRVHAAGDSTAIGVEKFGEPLLMPLNPFRYVPSNAF